MRSNYNTKKRCHLGNSYSNNVTLFPVNSLFVLNLQCLFSPDILTVTVLSLGPEKNSLFSVIYTKEGKFLWEMSLNFLK